MLLNCCVGEDSWESFGLQGNQTQSILKENSPEYSLEGLMLKLKLQHFGTLCEELTQWKRCWCWERLKAGGERDNRGQDGWMISPTRWTWVWVSSGSWWWTGKPGVLQSMGLQRVRHNWETELNWDKPTANILLNREIPKAFPLRWRTKQVCLLPWFLFNIVLKVFDTAIRKEIVEIQIEKEDVKLSQFADFC